MSVLCKHANEKREKMLYSIVFKHYSCSNDDKTCCAVKKYDMNVIVQVHKYVSFINCHVKGRQGQKKEADEAKNGESIHTMQIVC